MAGDKDIDQPTLFGKQGLTSQTLLPKLLQGTPLDPQLR
jgi:hypothetical protein